GFARTILRYAKSALHSQLSDKFLKCENPKALFLATCMILLEEGCQLEELESQWQCNSGHESMLGFDLQVHQLRHEGLDQITLFWRSRASDQTKNI
ncbi:MAG: hypothetical protein GY820_18980, partial [Gammaproteobacteria bacterium]|nr:hypothetical protein [Gammaproteobacteria bacterium]